MSQIPRVMAQATDVIIDVRMLASVARQSDTSHSVPTSPLDLKQGPQSGCNAVTVARNLDIVRRGDVRYLKKVVKARSSG